MDSGAMIGRIEIPLKSIIVASLFVAGLLVETPVAQAQSVQALERLEVVIWPEYDQPAALVMYRVWLPPDVVFPTTVALPMPSPVETPNAVAKRPIGGDLLLAPYTVEPDNGWKWAYIQTDAPEIRLEYYTELETDTSLRSFEFEWPGGPAIKSIAYEVMQPIGATDLSVSPSSGRPQLAADGLIYQREEIGSVPEGGRFFVNFEYTKATSGLTVAALNTMAPLPSPPTSPTPPPGPPLPADAEAVVSESQPSVSVWLTVLPVVLVAGLIVFWFVLRDSKVRD